MEIDALAGNWWALGLRGVTAILFGALTFTLPAVTLAVLVLLFGAYALVEGVLNVIAAVRGRGQAQPSWAPLVGGLVSIAAGIVTFVLPGLTELALLYVIAVWAVISGISEIVAAVGLSRRIKGEAWLGLNGLLSIVFGLLTMLIPGAGAVSVAWLIGAYAMVLGALLLGLSLRLRRWPAGQQSSILVRPLHGRTPSMGSGPSRACQRGARWRGRPARMGWGIRCRDGGSRT
jgi:uncharacterized membrane protein HdeD (DUF308 family)